MASDKGKMAMDKMKLYFKSKAHTYLTNCMDVFL